MTGTAIITIGVQDDADTALLKDTDHFEEALHDGLETQKMTDEVEVDDIDYVEDAETVIMHLTCDPSTGANYAEWANAEGLSTDLHFAFSSGLDRPAWYTCEVEVLRATFCDHPDERVTLHREEHEEGTAEWAECGECDEALPPEAAQ